MKIFDLAYLLGFDVQFYDKVTQIINKNFDINLIIYLRKIFMII